jgi:hypothetical protein
MSDAAKIGEYRTEVLSLAVYLNLEGHCHQRLEMRGGKAVWVFLATDDLNDLVNTYQLDQSMVETRSFMDELVRCRRELFAFLDSHKRAANA